MEQKAPQYLKLVKHGFNDKDVDDLIEHFRGKGRRAEFFKEFKELEILYEINLPGCVPAPVPRRLHWLGRCLCRSGEGVHEAGVRR